MQIFDEAQANRTYWRLKSLIDHDYQRGEWVALDEEGVVDHDLDFERLYQRLTALRLAPDRAVVVRAGVEFPNYGDVFPVDWSNRDASNKHSA
jgi:hypothetical protein